MGEPVIRAACLAAASLAFASPAAAATCSVTPQGLSFGSYDSLSSAPLDGVGNINVSCDASASFTVSLGSGSGSYDQRLLTGGADQLGYNLYTDATRTTVWGDGIVASNVSGTGTNIDLPVYGRIGGSQNVSASTYTDAIIVTVSY